MEKDDGNRSYALTSTGLLYEHGNGVERNYKEVFEYYGQSADIRNKGAYFNLALLYYYGKVVVKSFGIALEWLNRVILEELKESNMYVLVQVENNTGYDLSKEKQRKYSIVSENNIYGEAHYYLDLMLKVRYRVDKNNEKALYHFKIAHLQGAEKAQQYLNLKRKCDQFIEIVLLTTGISIIIGI